MCISDAKLSPWILKYKTLGSQVLPMCLPSSFGISKIYNRRPFALCYDTHFHTLDKLHVYGGAVHCVVNLIKF